MNKIYTKLIHKSLQNALRNGFRVDHQPHGNFIKAIWNNKKGIIISYNTMIVCRSALTKEAFLKMKYNEMITELEKAYKQTQANQIYTLND